MAGLESLMTGSVAKRLILSCHAGKFDCGNWPSVYQKRSMCESGGTKQTKDERHSLFGHTPALAHLKSRYPFLPNVQPMDFSAKTVRCTNQRARLREKPHIDVGLPTEDLAKGHNSPWITWRSLNRLRTGYTCSREQWKKWKYYA